jgi:hypothetical protein
VTVKLDSLPAPRDAIPLASTDSAGVAQRTQQGLGVRARAGLDGLDGKSESLKIVWLSKFLLMLDGLE